MMQQLQQMAGTPAKGKADKDAPVRLLPPLDATDLAGLKARIPAPLPDEIRELLSLTRGLTGLLPEIDFSGLPGFAFMEAFPHGLPIAHDGAGNYWVVDLMPGQPRWGPVFFACHTPAVIAFQCDDLAQFIDQLVAMHAAEDAHPLQRMQTDVVMRIWRRKPHLLTPEAAAAGDDRLREWAAQYGARDVICDLRRPQFGDGFPWGMFGPRTEIHRHDHERLFSIRHKSWWSRLRGR